MIYTGNNGRIYLARSASTGLTGSFSSIAVNANVGAIQLTETLTVRSITGQGRGAQVKISSAINDSQTSRNRDFTVAVAGSGYQAGDIIRICRVTAAGILQDLTPSITVASVATLGLDSDVEVIQDAYRIAKIRSWTLNSSSEVVETTALGDVAKTFSPALVSGDGSATLLFYEDQSTNQAVGVGQDAFDLMDILFPRSVPPRVVLSLSIDGSVVSAAPTATDALWKTNFLFNAYITSASLGVSYGEVVTVDVNFTIDGPLLDVPKKA